MKDQQNGWCDIFFFEMESKRRYSCFYIFSQIRDLSDKNKIFSTYSFIHWINWTVHWIDYWGVSFTLTFDISCVLFHLLFAKSFYRYERCYFRKRFMQYQVWPYWKFVPDHTKNNSNAENNIFKKNLHLIFFLITCNLLVLFLIDFCCS